MKAAIAGFCGSVAHTLLMYLKSRIGLLPSFQPYESLQSVLSQAIGGEVHPVVPWALSFLNGATLLGFGFGRLYPHLPGRGGAAKGLAFGIAGWLLMGVAFFPLIGLGLFATGLGLGIAPALFSLAMILAYSLVLGAVYGWLSERAGLPT
ncbi:MAG: DUF6789 family protein [Bradyrhizobium sp.]|uniref:DUF6789 family protein n=1 Tax=Bradyrhizobium sp. TaxID=376 RepID=UPI003D0CF392